MGKGDGSKVYAFTIKVHGVLLWKRSGLVSWVWLAASSYMSVWVAT